jgi:hypothetical protein
MPLAEDLADPDMCGHLWPGADPGARGAFGAVDAFGDGLAAVEEGVAPTAPHAFRIAVWQHCSMVESSTPRR